MLAVTHLSGFGAGGSTGNLLAVYSTETAKNHDGTYTFSDVRFGEDVTSRLIVLGTSLRSSSPLTVPTITAGGTSATLVVATDGDTDTATTYVGLWRVDPTGTSGDVVVSFADGDSARCGLMVWAIFPSSATPVDTDTGVGAGIASMSLSVPGGGWGIGYSYAHGVLSTAWTGLGNTQQDTFTTTVNHTGADDAIGASTSIGVDYGGNDLFSGAVCAGWSR